MLLWISIIQKYDKSVLPRVKLGKIERVAAKIIAKWLKKGNMARAMRDILPYSGLSYYERNTVATIVHNVVRYKKLYDYLMEKKGIPNTPYNYVKLSKNKVSWDMEIPYHIQISASEKLAEILKDNPEFERIINREPQTTLCTNFIKITRENLIENLKLEGFEAEPYLPESAVLTVPEAKYSVAVKSGLAHVQDASSQMAAKLTGELGDAILDYCAGNGGKTLAMASIFRNKKVIYAYDINSKKLETLKHRSQIYGADIKIMDKREAMKYDVVLVDAPCSGVGAAARNPEAKYQEDFEKYADNQIAILEEARKYVKKSGFLVYVVCSFTPQETSGVIEKFLSENSEYTLNTEIFSNISGIVKTDSGAFITLGDILFISVLKKS